MIEIKNKKIPGLLNILEVFEISYKLSKQWFYTKQQTDTLNTFRKYYYIRNNLI